MVQNCKVVHWPVKALDTAELKQGFELPASYHLPTAQTRRSQNCESDGFKPYPVWFEPIPVLVVHPGTNKMAHLCMDGPMDKNSVKNCATVTLMRQNLDNTIFRCGSQLAWEATRWTRYASAIWSFRLANHIFLLAQKGIHCKESMYLLNLMRYAIRMLVRIKTS
jgi:hypothetical protein